MRVVYARSIERGRILTMCRKCSPVGGVGIVVHAAGTATMTARETAADLPCPRTSPLSASTRRARAIRSDTTRLANDSDPGTLAALPQTMMVR
jgi:hypothetical protein